MKKRWLLLLEETEQTVTELFNTQVNPVFIFHNLAHTQWVVNAAKEIMSWYRLTQEEQFVVLIAAWFHDTGFSAGRMEGHEWESIKIATTFLRQHEETEDIISQVASCIEATKIPQQPLTVPAKIVCDADLFHLGTDEFPVATELLRQESEQYFGRSFSQQEWDQGNINFLQAHHYFTGYCRQKSEPVKRNWLMQCIDRSKEDMTGYES